MRILIDNSLSPGVKRFLEAAGHDVLHVRDLGMQDYPDEPILTRAAEDARVLVAADTDFPTLLALGRRTTPSVLLVRGGLPRQPEALDPLLVTALSLCEPELQNGCLVVFNERGLRTRRLPLI